MSRDLRLFQILEDAGQIKPAQAEALSQAKEQAAREDTLHRRAKNFNKSFGKSYLSSGAGRAAAGSDYLLDWGLIEMDAGRMKDPEYLSACNVFFHSHHIPGPRPLFIPTNW